MGRQRAQDDEFEQLEDGEDWVFLADTNGDIVESKHQCCRCGMVHRIEIERRHDRVILRFWKENSGVLSFFQWIRGLWERLRNVKWLGFEGKQTSA